MSQLNVLPYSLNIRWTRTGTMANNRKLLIDCAGFDACAEPDTLVTSECSIVHLIQL